MNKIIESIWRFIKRQLPIAINIVALVVLINLRGIRGGLFWYIILILIETLIIYLLNREAFNMMYLGLIRMIELKLFGHLNERGFRDGDDKRTSNPTGKRKARDSKDI